MALNLKLRVRYIIMYIVSIVHDNSPILTKIYIVKLAFRRKINSEFFGTNLLF